MAGREVQARPQRQKIGKRNKAMLAIVGLGGLITIGLGVLIAGYSYLNYQYTVTPKGPEQAVVFDVPRGSGLSSIAARLEEAGLIDDAFIFKAVTKMRGNEAAFKAGEYSLTTPVSMQGIFDTLSSGQAILYPFTAPEGWTSAQIVRGLGGVETLTGEIEQIPVEGTLLPETYLTPRGMSRQAVLDQMRAAQTKLIDELWETRAPNLPIKTKREAIILASVVEKETGQTSERDHVAGVFINRLNRGMRLESDPTIIYGLTRGEPLGRGLRRSEIDRKTEWNTYQVDGLPATAICNPGRDAIAAVLNPMETDDIFFVADGTGGHVFAQTYAQHLKNVAEWRKIERARRAAARQARQAGQ